ncbi:MAG: hypothetical protein KatS3mg065_1146 [Chloroflexota bacterium]|nr:MAG: hypothetical protein KatS3mg065_1146 [Chloroflexota bacterium]
MLGLGCMTDGFVAEVIGFAQEPIDQPRRSEVEVSQG